MKYIEDEMEQGLNPYPHKIDVSVSISEYIRKYGNLHDDEVVKDVDVFLEIVLNKNLLGRIMSKQCVFYDHLL